MVSTTHFIPNCLCILSLLCVFTLVSLVSSRSVYFSIFMGFVCYTGDELEGIRPYVYRNIAKQLNINVAVEAVVSDAFLSVATEIISMGKSGGYMRNRCFLCSVCEGVKLCPHFSKLYNRL